jgi:hypothetical protein
MTVDEQSKLKNDLSAARTRYALFCRFDLSAALIGCAAGRRNEEIKSRKRPADF